MRLVHALAPALVLAFALGFGLAADAETLRIVLGSQRRVALPADVQRVAVGDPGVTQVHLLTSRELLALGRGVGRTNVLLWMADGRVEELVLFVERDLSVLAAALRDIHPAIRVSAAPDRDAVVLRGRVPEARFSSAAEAMALDYLGESGGNSDSELYVSGEGTTESSAAPGGAEASASAEGGAVFLSGAPRRSDSDVVNLIQIEGLPPSLEARIRSAILPVGGKLVRVRRLVRGSVPSDAADTFVLEGEVRGQVELVRVLLAAAQLVSGTEVSESSIEVIANEAGSLASGESAGEPGFQLASVGGFSGAAGGTVRGGSVGNDLASNVARAKALSVGNGRILAFIDVQDLPQVRLETRIYEISRSRLREWEPNLNVLFGDELDDLSILPLPTAFTLVGDDAMPAPVTPTQVQAAASLLQGGAVAAGVQYVADHVALDVTLTLLEDASIARSLARPSLTVLSGEVARFNAGGQIPIAVTVDTQTSAAAGTLLSSTVFASFGVDVAVRAMVAEDDTITLDVTPSVSQPDFALTSAITEATGTGQTTTAFETRSLSTTTRLRDGQSFLIAGFLQSSISDSSRFTPGLHRVPGAGKLAQSRLEGADDTDFVIVVSPSIVRERLSRSELWQFPDPSGLLGGRNVKPRGNSEGTPSARTVHSNDMARADSGPTETEIGRELR